MVFIKKKKKKMEASRVITRTQKQDQNFFIFFLVRLNLFNYVLALFHTKFACNSAFRNPVFRWE